MTTPNTQRQKRYRENRLLTCWLNPADNDRLLKLMATLGYAEKGKLQDGYTEVIHLALEQLEKKLHPPRYGLIRLLPQEP